MLECVDQTGPKSCLEYFEIAWLIMSRTSLKNRSSRLIGWQDFPELQNSLKISSARCLEQQAVFSTRCPVDSTRVLVCYRFYILRFLLICHLDDLDLTFTLKRFFSLKNFRTLSQNTPENRVFRLFSSQNGFQRFFLKSWADDFENIWIYSLLS